LTEFTLPYSLNKQRGWHTLKLSFSLFSVTCFGRICRFKSVGIVTIQMENCAEYDASILKLHCLYIYPFETLKGIFPPQLSSIYFIVNLNLNRSNV